MARGKLDLQLRRSLRLRRKGLTFFRAIIIKYNFTIKKSFIFIFKERYFDNPKKASDLVTVINKNMDAPNSMEDHVNFLGIQLQLLRLSTVLEGMNASRSKFLFFLCKAFENVLAPKNAKHVGF